MVPLKVCPIGDCVLSECEVGFSFCSHWCHHNLHHHSHAIIISSSSSFFFLCMIIMCNPKCLSSYYINGLLGTMNGCKGKCLYNLKTVELNRLSWTPSISYLSVFLFLFQHCHSTLSNNLGFIFRQKLCSNTGSGGERGGVRGNWMMNIKEGT